MSSVCACDLQSISCDVHDGSNLVLQETVLQEADRLINGDRRGTYGPPSESFNRIAGLWSAYLGQDLIGLDVANLMVLLKVSRTKGTYHRDSYVDMAGYAALAEQLNDPCGK